MILHSALQGTAQSQPQPHSRVSDTQCKRYIVLKLVYENGNLFLSTHACTPLLARALSILLILHLLSPLILQKNTSIHYSCQHDTINTCIKITYTRKSEYIFCMYLLG